MPHIGELMTSRGGAAQAVSLGASPATFTANADGVVLVSGGTVSALAYGRLGVFTTVGVVAGAVPISKGDTFRVTYAVAPTITFIPA